MLDLSPGQTLTASGIIRDTIDLETDAVLTEATNDLLAIFGAILGPASGSATLCVTAGSTVYTAGAVGTSISIDFAGSSGTLELSNLYLPEMAGAIAGFVAGDVISIVSGNITDASIVSDTGGGSNLELSAEGTSVASIHLEDPRATSDVAFAIPDIFGDTRIVLGEAMAAVQGTAPAGSAWGTSFVWSGGTNGQWANASSWTTPGSAVSIAPGANDVVNIDGSLNTVLSIAGNGNATRLDCQGIVALAGNFAFTSLSAGAGASDALILSSACTVLASTATLDAGVLQVAAADASLVLKVSATLRPGLLWVADGGRFETPSLLLAGGVVRVGATGELTLGGVSRSAGVPDIGAGGLLLGYGEVRAPLWNDGEIAASNGVLAIYGSVGGSGIDHIAGGSTLYLPGGVEAGQRIVFDPSSESETLELFGSVTTCAATISGFGVGDVIDIASGTLSQVAWTPPQPGAGAIGVLDFGPEGTLDLGLAATVDATRVQFALTADGLGGTAVSIIACFCGGTRLASPHGSIAVEDVKPGVRLLSRSGAARLVRWVGQRTYSFEELDREQQLRPVRITAGSLGAGLPRSDLRLSPQHAVALPTIIGMQLVPAVLLVDGQAIYRENTGSDVSYFHVELESHDLLLAEDVAVESFLAEGPERRALFNRTQGYPLHLQTLACLPRLEGGVVIDILRKRFGLTYLPSQESLNSASCCGSIDQVRRNSEVWRIEGWAMSSETPAVIEIMIGPATYGRVVANGWRPDLDRAGKASGLCSFTAPIPATVIERLGGPISLRPTPQPYRKRPDTFACERVIGEATCSPWSTSRSGNSPKLSCREASSTIGFPASTGTCPAPGLETMPSSSFARSQNSVSRPSGRPSISHKW